MILLSLCAYWTVLAGVLLFALSQKVTMAFLSFPQTIDLIALFNL